MYELFFRRKILFLYGLFESLLEQRQLRHQIRNRIHERLLWGVIRSSLYPDDEFVFQWMWHLVSGKQDVRIFQQLVTDHIS